MLENSTDLPDPRVIDEATESPGDGLTMISFGGASDGCNGVRSIIDKVNKKKQVCTMLRHCAVGRCISRSIGRLKTFHI